MTYKKPNPQTMRSVKSILDLHEAFNKRTQSPLPESLNSLHKSAKVAMVMFALVGALGVYKTATNALERDIAPALAFGVLAVLCRSGFNSSLLRRGVSQYYIQQASLNGSQATEASMREFIRPLRENPNNPRPKR